MRLSLHVFAPLLLSLLAACVVPGPRDRFDDRPEDEDAPASSFDDSGGGGGGCVADDPAGDLCGSGSDCQVTCFCDDGSVDSGSCTNGSCDSADDACAGACADFGLGAFTGGFCDLGGGGSSGGGSSGGSSGGGSSGGQTGDTCQLNDECASRACLVEGGATFGYCTTPCDDFTDCPTFWDCVEVGNASSRYCQQD